MILQCERLLLREFHISDLPSFLELESSPQTYFYETRAPDEAAVRKYIENAQRYARHTPRIYYRFAITLPPADQVIGRLSLYLQNSEIDEWEIGWAIHPDCWSKGYASEAARRVVDFAFAERKIRRLVAFCHTANTASVRVMQKIGMQKEGCLRQVRFCRGAWCDEFIYAMLAEDWCHDRQ